MDSNQSSLKKYVQIFQKDEIIFQQGEVGQDFYVIRSGAVILIKKVLDVERIIATLKEGEFFGETAVLSNNKRHNTAKALEETHVLRISNETFEIMISKNTEIAIRMIRKLIERVDKFERLTDYISFETPVGRAIHYIYQVLEALNSLNLAETNITLDLNDICEVTHISPHTILNILDRLAQINLVYHQGDGYIIPNMDRFKKYYQYLILADEFKDLS